MITMRTKEGSVVAEQDLGLYKGLIPVDLPEPKESDMVLHFQGHKMPLDVWRPVSAFMLWSQETYKGEAQCRLFYRESDGAWRAVVAPQYISHGLSTDEVAVHPDKETAFACQKEGFVQIGTVHHHCTAGAFQSGTDHRDEITQNGLHITLGNLGSAELSVHARVTFRKICYKADLTEWLAFDPKLLQTPYAEEPFPAEWKARLVKRAEVGVYQGDFSGTGASWWDGKRTRRASYGYAYSYDPPARDAEEAAHERWVGQYALSLARANPGRTEDWVLNMCVRVIGALHAISAGAREASITEANMLDIVTKALDGYADCRFPLSYEAGIKRQARKARDGNPGPSKRAGKKQKALPASKRECHLCKGNGGYYSETWGKMAICPCCEQGVNIAKALSSVAATCGVCQGTGVNLHMIPGPGSRPCACNTPPPADVAIFRVMETLKQRQAGGGKPGVCPHCNNDGITNTVHPFICTRCKHGQTIAAMFAEPSPRCVACGDTGVLLEPSDPGPCPCGTTQPSEHELAEAGLISLVAVGEETCGRCQGTGYNMYTGDECLECSSRK